MAEMNGTPEEGGLLNNPLLLQYLAGAGVALSSDQPVGAALGNITMQNIAAQNQVKLLRSMLSGLPTGAKLSGDRDNLSLKIPTSSLLGQELAGTGDLSTTSVNPGLSGGVAMDISSNYQGSTQTLGSLLNPSSSPLDNISPADLAGLTPNDITQAVSLAQTVKERQAASEIAKTRANTAAQVAIQKNQIFVRDVPGYGNLSLEQYKALTNEDRNYVTYVMAARQRGENPMTKEEYSKMKDKSYHPTTAMGAAINRDLKDNVPLTNERLKYYTELFREDKTPSPMTWTTAMNEVDKLFSSQDPTGMWVITPELQGARNKAAELLVDYKREGMDPQEAINRANKEARVWNKTVTDKYDYYIQQAQGNQQEIDRIKSTFMERYGFLPR